MAEKKKIRPLGVVAAVLAVGFLGSQIGGQDSQETTKPTPTQTTNEPAPEPVPSPSDFYQALSIGQGLFPESIAAFCEPVSEIVGSSELRTKSSSRQQQLGEITDSYDADDFVSQNEWVRPLVTLETTDEIDALLRSNFDSLLDVSEFEGAKQFEESYPPDYQKAMEAFSGAVLEECGLVEAYEEMGDLFGEATRVVRLANNVPWYPKGFREYADGLTAWDWTDRNCSYNYARCSHMDVIAALQCSSLYVEVNFLDSSGSVVDWSNDTARNLRAGQTAKLEFVSFDDYARQVELVEILCY